MAVDFVLFQLTPLMHRGYGNIDTFTANGLFITVSQGRGAGP